MFHLNISTRKQSNPDCGTFSETDCSNPSKMLMPWKINRRGNYSRLKETKETWQLNAMCEPIFYPESGKDTTVVAKFE